jgi:predicted dehydrogenase
MYDTAEMLLRDCSISAVIIASPTRTHLSNLALAVEKRKAVFVEKPLVSSLAEIEEIERLAAVTRIPIMVGFNRRYWEPVRRLRKRVQDGSGSSRAEAQLVLSTDIGAWSPICEAGDPLDDLTCHQLDVLHYVFNGEIVTIRARWLDVRAIKLQVRLADGTMAKILSNHGHIYQESIFVRQGQDEYEIRGDSERLTPARGVERRILDAYDALRRRLFGQAFSLRRSYELELASFVDCIRTGRTPRPDVFDGIWAARAVLAVRESAATGGKEVFL